MVEREEEESGGGLEPRISKGPVMERDRVQEGEELHKAVAGFVCSATF